jgi:hypothetical protein
MIYFLKETCVPVLKSWTDFMCFEALASPCANIVSICLVFQQKWSCHHLQAIICTIRAAIYQWSCEPYVVCRIYQSIVLPTIGNHPNYFISPSNWSGLKHTFEAPVRPVE